MLPGWTLLHSYPVLSMICYFTIAGSFIVIPAIASILAIMAMRRKTSGMHIALLTLIILASAAALILSHLIESRRYG